MMRLLCFVLTALCCHSALAEERLTVQPNELRAGAARQIVVRLRTTDTDDARFSASRGELSTPVRTKTGFEATLTLPKEDYPHIVLVSAQAGRDEPRFARIRVWGRGTAEVKASPGRRVMVTVAGVEFGPAVTDRSGRASIPVDVPPGVTEADFEGHALPLHAPLQARAFVAVSRRSIGSDGGKLQVFAVAVSPSGEWLSGAGVLELAAPNGALSAPVAMGERYVATWELPPTDKASVMLTARVRGAAGGSAEVRVEVTGGRARKLLLSAPARLEAGSTVVVRLRSEDRFGRPASSVPVLSCEGVKLGAVRASSSGEFFADLTAPQKLGARSVVLRARADEAEASASLELSAGRAAKLVVAESESLVADGSQPLTVTARPVDAYGNTTADPVSSPDTIGVGRDPSGNYVIRLEPRTVDAALELAVPLRAGDVSAVTTLRLRPPRLSFSADVGLMSNLSDVVGPTVGARASFWPAASFGAAVDAHGSAFSATNGDARAETRALSFAALFAYRTAVGGTGVQLLAGPELSLLQTASNLGSGPRLEDSGRAAGVRASASVAMRMGGGYGFVELSAGGRNVAAFSNLSGALTWVGFGAGYRLDAL